MLSRRSHRRRRCGLGRAARCRPGANIEGRRQRRRGRADDPPARAPQHRGERQGGLGLWHPPGGRDLRPQDRGGQTVSCSGRERHRRAEPHPLARDDAALAAGWRAGDFRPAHSCRRKRRLRLPLKVRRHVLDALPSGPAGAVAHGRAAYHPRSARPGK